MIKFENFTLEKLPQIKTVAQFENHSKSVVYYYNIECGFDIETSSTMLNNQKFAFMYEWTFGIKDKNFICYGRTWEQFIELCEKLQQHFDLDENNRLIIYVHNLSYEFQFMRKYFDWVNVFAVDDRKPIKALTTYGIEFRDSYILSGYSLSKLAENLVSHKIKKLVGDLDYKLVRTYATELTENELAYCNNDVEIILYYINEQIEQYGDITKIPLTNTGRVRKFVRDNCLHYNKTNHKKEGIGGKIGRYRELMNECLLNPVQYQMLKRCFMGGFTHASMQHVCKLHKNVSSIDFTSSYPYVMLSEKFPMSKPTKIDVRTVDFWELVNDENVGLMFDCKIEGLHAKNTYESYLSESKCFDIVNAIVNNGRIFECDELKTTITDIDLRIIKQCYNYDKISVTNCYQFYMQYLPKQVLLSILDLYGAKTTLKGVSGKEVEYLLKKGMLNSVYGMCVTDIVRGEITYNDKWDKTEITTDLINEQIDKYNTSKNRFLYYPWGVWVTAYARKNLWTGILNIGKDYIYSDTDSIKFLNYEKHVDFIEWYNKDVERKLKKMCEFRKIDFELCKPKTIKGIEKLIGVWDYEGCYTRFKTLGAKRYMYEENGKIHITIAGLSKQNGLKYMLKKCNGDNTKVFDMFNDDLYIPPEYTGKNTHTYIDDEMSGKVTDYKGKTVYIKSLSSIHLSDCDFTLSISKQYNTFLRMLKEGYLFTGNKHI